MTRTTPSLPDMTFRDLMRHLQIASGVHIQESFSDADYNASRYARWAELDYVRILPEDRGDGIGRVSIEPTVMGRDARSSKNWFPAGNEEVPA